MKVKPYHILISGRMVYSHSGMSIIKPIDLAIQKSFHFQKTVDGFVLNNS